MKPEELQKELDRTKIALMQTQQAAFFTTIVFNLKFKWDETCETAYTDGYIIGWNPEWFMKLTKEERVGVFMHEASHVAYDHIGRTNGRIMSKWNRATDYVINNMLHTLGIKLPSSVLMDHQYDNKSAEEIYEIIPDDEENSMEDLRIPNQDGEGNPVTPDQYRQHIEDLVIRAATQAKMDGSSPFIPGEVEAMITKILKPRLPWKTILRREVADMVKSRYTWTRPNRRYYPDYYLPSRHSKDVTELSFYVDISTSVSDHQFSIFVSEIANTFKMFDLKKLRIVQFDTKIKSIHVVSSLSQLMAIKFIGRGGTDPECIFEDMDTYKPKLALVFTDGWFDWQRNTMKQRLLWLINDNERFKPLFGRALHFSTKDMK